MILEILTGLVIGHFLGIMFPLEIRVSHHSTTTQNSENVENV